MVDVYREKDKTVIEKLKNWKKKEIKSWTSVENGGYNKRHQPNEANIPTENR